MPNDKYHAWVLEEAWKAGSDGCTMVTDIYVWACYEHDLGYRFGKDPQVAFEVGWDWAPPISRGEVDKRFRQAIQDESVLGRFSPVSWVRWIGVRVGGFFLWKHHKKVG